MEPAPGAARRGAAGCSLARRGWSHCAGGTSGGAGSAVDALSPVSGEALVLVGVDRSHVDLNVLTQLLHDREVEEDLVEQLHALSFMLASSRAPRAFFAPTLRRIVRYCSSSFTAESSAPRLRVLFREMLREIRVCLFF